MKKLIWIGIATLVLASCNENKKESPVPAGGLERVYLHSYVPVYVDGEWASLEGAANYFTMRLDGSGQSYMSPDIYKVSDEEIVGFQRLAEQNGDVSFNREDYWLSYIDRASYVYNLKAIQIVCTNHDWGTDYPAGASLADRVRVRFVSYGAFVDSGYTLMRDGIPDIAVHKLLSELTEADLKMINPYDLRFEADPKPAPKVPYEMRVTFVTTDGVEKVVTDTFEVK